MPFNLGNITLAEQLLVSYGIGTAAGPALEPFAQSLANDAWTLNQVIPPNAYVLAEGVAQGKVDPATAIGWAAEQGLGGTQFAALVSVFNGGPDLGLAYRAWRRGLLTDSQFSVALKRTGLEDQWFTALEGLKAERLDLGAISTAVHRGIMQDAGLLVTPVPSGSGNVPRIPVSPIDTLTEFAAQGIDAERARILVADTGLPLSLGEMLQLYNRNAVTATDVKVSIAESNVRNEYMDVALDLARRLLTPHEYAEADLRGVLDSAAAKTGASLSGLDGTDYDTLYAITGRPISVHAITTGLARGGTYGGTYTDVPEPYQDAIRRSAIRPEYAKLAHANRYTYPSGFQLKAEAVAGDLTEAQTEQLLLEMGWDPKWAKFFAQAWTGKASGTAVDPHVKKAETTLYTEAHKAYVKTGLTQAQVAPALNELAVPAAAQAEVFRLWDMEKQLAAEVPPGA